MGVRGEVCPVLVSTIYIFRIHSLPMGGGQEFRDSANIHLQIFLGNI